MAQELDASKLQSPNTRQKFLSITGRLEESSSIHDTENASLLQQTRVTFREPHVTPANMATSTTALRTSDFFGRSEDLGRPNIRLEVPRLSRQTSFDNNNNSQSPGTFQACESPQNDRLSRTTTINSLQNTISLQIGLRSNRSEDPKNGTQLLDWIFRDATKRFVSDPGTCVAEVLQGRRCTITVATKEIIENQINDAQGCIERLANLEYPLGASECCKELNAIRNLIFCKRSHSKFVWENVIGCRNTQTTCKNLKAKKKKSRSPNCSAKSTRARPSRTRKPQNHIQNLQPCVPESAGHDIVKHLMKIVSRDLLPETELKPGRIYVYWVDNFGRWKIGTTKREVAVRLKEWERQCQHKFQLVYPLETDNVGLIPRAKRLEKIIHAELIDYRYTEQCVGCGQKHGEWFQLQDEHVRAVIKKWRDWIATEPYENVGSKWRLKDQHRSVLKSLCQSLEYNGPKHDLGDRKYLPVKSKVRRSKRIAQKRAVQEQETDQRRPLSSEKDLSEIKSIFEGKNELEIAEILEGKTESEIIELPVKGLHYLYAGESTTNSSPASRRLA